MPSGDSTSYRRDSENLFLASEDCEHKGISKGGEPLVAAARNLY
jgi:hypothetical protein